MNQKLASAPGADYFRLFGLTYDYNIDTDRLNETYRQLQRNFHPDRYTHAGIAEQRLAQQRSGQINDGYRVLKDPLLRASHLLHCLGVEIPAETTISDPQLLMQYASWRQRLDKAQTDADQAELGRLLTEVSEDFDRSTRDFVATLKKNDSEAGKGHFFAMQFARRLQSTIKNAGH